MHACVDLVAPLVELELEVVLVGEAAARFEVGAHEAMAPLEYALGLRVARLEDDPADRQLAAEAREGVTCPPTS